MIIKLLWDMVQMLYSHLQYHNDTIIKTDAMIKTQEDLFNNILPLTLLQGFERVVHGLRVRGCWRPNIICNFLTPLLWPSRCVFLVLLMLNRRPRAHCWMLAFFIAAYQHLLWTPNSIGVSEGSLGQVWLSLPHLVSSCLEPSWQLPWLVKLNSII